MNPSSSRRFARLIVHFALAVAFLLNRTIRNLNRGRRFAIILFGSALFFADANQASAIFTGLLGGDTSISGGYPLVVSPFGVNIAPQDSAFTGTGGSFGSNLPFTYGADTLSVSYTGSAAGSPSDVSVGLVVHVAASGPDPFGTDGAGIQHNGVGLNATASSRAGFGSIPLDHSPTYDRREWYMGAYHFIISGNVAPGDAIRYIFNIDDNASPLGAAYSGNIVEINTPGSFSADFLYQGPLISSSGIYSIGEAVAFYAEIGKGSGGGTTYIDLDPTISITATPEPSTMVMGAMGLIGLMAYGRRRRRAA